LARLWSNYRKQIRENENPGKVTLNYFSNHHQ